MTTNPRKYMREYMRKQRRPYKRLSILEKLQCMGFMAIGEICNESEWYYKRCKNERR